MRIDGGCHCGFITYQGEADPEKAGICHCTDCQVLTGTAYRVSVPVAEASFKISGEPTVYVKTADSGNKREQAFCPRCGSPIYATSPRPGPKTSSIRLRPGPTAAATHADTADLDALEAALGRRSRLGPGRRHQTLSGHRRRGWHPSISCI